MAANRPAYAYPELPISSPYHKNNPTRGNEIIRKVQSKHMLMCAHGSKIPVMWHSKQLFNYF